MYYINISKQKHSIQVNSMEKTSTASIQIWNNNLFNKLTPTQQKSILNAGYDNSNNTEEFDIINSYFMLLRLSLSWPRIKELVNEIKTTLKLDELNTLKGELSALSRLSYDAFESEFILFVEDFSMDYLYK